VSTETEAFLSDLPKVHDRPPTPPHSGGLNPRLGRVIAEQIEALDSPSVIETGAGCSVTSIAPDPKLGDRIRQEAEARDLDVARLTYVCDRSERALPRLALDQRATCEAAFIDGNHGWPTVMVDFCYLNMMLQRGGLLFIDDVQIYACTQLMLLLRGQPEFEQISLAGKMATFRKVTREPFLPDSAGEPFIMANSTNLRFA
jgi:Methyltransferase domain